MKYLLIIFSFVFFLLASCRSNGGETNADANEQLVDTVYTVQYAKGFTVELYPDYKVVTVRNPRDTTKVFQQYVLVEKSKDLPQHLPKGTLIRTPLSAVVTYSTIHSSSLNELGKETTIIGVCEPEYIAIPYIQKSIQKGTIANLGKGVNPDIEKIIDIEPEAIWATPMDGQTYGNVEKIGVPIIETPDYMEQNPLGRAEWLRFYSLFYENESYVDSLFQQTVDNYNRIKEKTGTAPNRPTVFNDLMYRGVWNISAGNSFMSQMYHDAGGEYVWAKIEGDISIPYSFEQVLHDAGDADIWLIKYIQDGELTYGKLEDEYKPYSYFEAFKKRNVYECNTTQKTYYEDLPIHPDYVLQDLAYIFHPELFPEYTPRYYSKMKE